MTAPPRSDAALADVRQQIREIARSVLNRDIDPAVDVFDHGVTSLAFIRIVAQVNARYDIAVDVAELEEASIDALSELITEQLSSQQPAEARHRE